MSSSIEIFPQLQSKLTFVPDTQVLVKSMLSVAVDPEDKWFGYLMADPALFHSTMLHSATHKAMLTGSTHLSDHLSLNLEIIRFINARLGDPILGLSDATIGGLHFYVIGSILYSVQPRIFEDGFWLHLHITPAGGVCLFGIDRIKSSHLWLCQDI